MKEFEKTPNRRRAPLLKAPHFRKARILIEEAYGIAGAF
jgi:hypothetical protein